MPTINEKAIVLIDFVHGSGYSSDALRADAVACRDMVDNPPNPVLITHVQLGFRLLDFVHAAGESSDVQRGYANDLAQYALTVYVSQ